MFTFTCRIYSVLMAINRLSLELIWIDLWFFSPFCVKNAYCVQFINWLDFSRIIGRKRILNGIFTTKIHFFSSDLCIFNGVFVCTYIDSKVVIWYFIDCARWHFNKIMSLCFDFFCYFLLWIWHNQFAKIWYFFLKSISMTYFEQFKWQTSMKQMK